MYWLIAIVRPFKLSDVYDRLISEGVGGMTVTEVKGFGNQRADTEIYRGNAYTSHFVAKIKIEVAVCEEELDRVIESIVEVSKTGSPGDGKIFVYKLESALRIRTGEIDLDAI
jgi:nitrogen regulatory protein PII